MEQTIKNNTTTTVQNENKKIAVIAYITIIGLIVAFVMNNDKKLPFVQYHITQSLGLALTGIALGLIGIIPIIGWIISILGTLIIIYMWIMGLLNGINEKEKPVPLLGKHYEKCFENL